MIQYFFWYRVVLFHVIGQKKCYRRPLLPGPASLEEEHSICKISSGPHLNYTAACREYFSRKHIFQANNLPKLSLWTLLTKPLLHMRDFNFFEICLLSIVAGSIYREKQKTVAKDQFFWVKRTTVLWRNKLLRVQMTSETQSTTAILHWILLNKQAKQSDDNILSLNFDQISF